MTTQQVIDKWFADKLKYDPLLKPPSGFLTEYPSMMEMALQSSPRVDVESIDIAFDVVALGMDRAHINRIDTSSAGISLTTVCKIDSDKTLALLQWIDYRYPLATGKSLKPYRFKRIKAHYVAEKMRLLKMGIKLGSVRKMLQAEKAIKDNEIKCLSVDSQIAVEGKNGRFYRYGLANTQVMPNGGLSLGLVSA